MDTLSLFQVHNPGFRQVDMSFLDYGFQVIDIIAQSESFLIVAQNVAKIEKEK